MFLWGYKFKIKQFYKLTKTLSNRYLNPIEIGSNLRFFSDRKNGMNRPDNLTAQNVVNLDPVINCDHGKFEWKNKFALLRELKKRFLSHILWFRIIIIQCCYDSRWDHRDYGIVWPVKGNWAMIRGHSNNPLTRLRNITPPPLPGVMWHIPSIQIIIIYFSI